MSPVPEGPVISDLGNAQGQGQLATFRNCWFCAINVATWGVRVCFVRRWLFFEYVANTICTVLTRRPSGLTNSSPFDLHRSDCPHSHLAGQET